MVYRTSIRRRGPSAYASRGARAKYARAKSYRKTRSAYSRARVVPGYTRRSGYYGGIESKFFETTAQNTAFTAAGVIVPSLNLIPQGTSECERDGRKAHMTSIHWKGIIRLNATTSSETVNNVRIIMYMDKQTNGQAAAVTDILEQGDFMSFNNLANRQRFRVLWDKKMSLNAAAFSSTTSNTKDYYMEFHKQCNIPLEFSSTTGAITELRSNNVGMIFISEGTGGTAEVQEWNARIRFTG